MRPFIDFLSPMGEYSEFIKDVVRTNMHLFPENRLPHLKDLDGELEQFSQSLNGDRVEGREAIRRHLIEVIAKRES
jgi:hypothetical protein